MAASFHAKPSWQWSDDVPAPSQMPSGNVWPPPATSSPSTTEQAENHSKAQARPPKHHRPRTCRICLETVQPSFEPVLGNLASIINPTPSVSYISSDPASGRLIRPCKCKGSSRYVHEGCLRAWRHADPGYAKRNFWQCPTCGFRYRLERMRWAAWISSTGTQIVLTLSILCLAMFLLGFVADPIINLYLDPYHTISSVPLSKWGKDRSDVLLEENESSWTEHFVKGLASLGLLGFVKVLLAMSPWHWWNLRNSGLMGRSGRAAGSGRDRLASISWVVVMIGVSTFIWGVYKGVRAWSRRWLEKAGERVIDVQADDVDDDADADDVNHQDPAAVPRPREASVDTNKDQ